ncbi:hypothetical protein Q4543_17535 [Salipiger sp. 1_MG-2023]|uniref:hypothetical protein n=1 Tax=Salipiger sp. 1_MG-2023 TaxID=3062665 RepID=UPI0026E178C2|nr:hypothetical protein [Salipiger sp. 1_MG-2023]MDO6587317.1 hypothetical protein [Salipiger sp. 1_MG-2023]
MQRRVFDAVRRHPGVLDADGVASRIYDTADGGALDATGCVRAFVCSANKRLRPYGLRIKQAGGYRSGYIITNLKG